MNFDLKGGPIAHPKKFLVLSDRVGLDKFVSSDKTVEFGLVWQIEPLQNRKNSFWRTLIVTGLSLRVNVIQNELLLSGIFSFSFDE